MALPTNKKKKIGSSVVMIGEVVAKQKPEIRFKVEIESQSK
ncbi:hypothetical protein CCACVL1_16512 [Corchorus capsularis]|uniref:Uncharacterized protein n=1 Tax=Corchorus capsularis TaxID=210143 RepID=A0A1R3HWJ5_COCAP|nr:hypothetical protein CCACVL1_16512 [Corchorus capsularis]